MVLICSEFKFSFDMYNVNLILYTKIINLSTTVTNSDNYKHFLKERSIKIKMNMCLFPVQCSITRYKYEQAPARLHVCPSVPQSVNWPAIFGTRPGVI